MISNKDQRNRPISNVSAAMPALIKQVKDNAFAILSNNFSQFFSSCDDLFFDLASKAGSNNEQNLYFESMREVRIKKSEIWNQFKTRYDDNFRNLTSSRTSPYGNQSQSPAEIGPGLDAIKLIDKDDMEQDVAITGIVTRARIENQELLYQLNCRFDYLMPDVRINENNNPLDPAQICNAVVESIKTLDLNIKCKVILLKHLDRTVILELRNIYSLANDLLISAGVLPQIRFDLRKNQTGGAQKTQPAEGTAFEIQQAENAAFNSSIAAPAQELSQLLGMLGQLRSAGVVMPRAISHPVGSDAAPISQQALLDALTTLQLSRQYVERPQSLDIRHAIEQILSANTGAGTDTALYESDEDIINLVAMFFDFVLDDRNLPVPVQALISRLQIPILKVALKDKSFFSNNKHPARLLINDIATSAVGWDESSELEQEKLYREANRVVHQVIENFTGNLDVFEAANEEFQKVSKPEQQKATVVEKRTQEAAMGKAKAEHARAQAQDVLYNRLKQSRLPASIMDFLVQDWLRVLLYVQLKYGVESTEWLEAKQVVELLAWGLRPLSDERSLQRLDKIKGDVLIKMTHGLEAIKASTDHIQNTLAITEQTFDMVRNRNLADADLVALNPQQIQILGRSVEATLDHWDQLSERQRDQLKSQSAAKEFLAKVEKIRPGTWAIYTADENQKKYRCKLAMVTEPGDSYIFVNRFGLRVFEKKKQEIATDLQKGHLKLLENGMLFDRAMDNITDKLKRLAS